MGRRGNHRRRPGPALVSSPGQALLLDNGAAGLAGGLFNVAGQLFANDGDATRLNLGETGIAIVTGGAGGAGQAFTAARYGTGFGYGIGGFGTGGLSGLGIVAAVNVAGEGAKHLVGEEPGWSSMAYGSAAGYAVGRYLSPGSPTLGAWFGASAQEVTAHITNWINQHDEEEQWNPEGNREENSGEDMEKKSERQPSKYPSDFQSPRVLEFN